MGLHCGQDKIKLNAKLTPSCLEVGIKQYIETKDCTNAYVCPGYLEPGQFWQHQLLTALFWWNLMIFQEGSTQCLPQYIIYELM